MTWIDKKESPNIFTIVNHVTLLETWEEIKLIALSDKKRIQQIYIQSHKFRH